jgi:tRNA pseudouridine38-40 synthase
LQAFDVKVCLGLEYAGSKFAGWQTQSHATTIQAAVENALARVADHPVALQAAGRTDAGVHATRQVAHFESSASRTLRAWILGVNSNLPPEISVQWAATVPMHFDARFSATARRYRYVILNRLARSGVWHDRVTWEHRPLDVELMQAASSHLLGAHDFSSFRAAGCQARHANRTLHGLDITRRGELILIDIEANAFLQHMVRNIVGVLLEVGRGDRMPNWAREVLNARDRRCAGITAPASGLYLTGVRYPPQYALDSWPQSLPFDR